MEIEKKTISTDELLKAKDRIKPFVVKTPILSSEELNADLGHEIYFKAENFQKTGAFKVRGVFNALLALKETGKNPEIVAYSSGNHGKAVAYAGGILGFKSNILVAKEISELKKRSIRELGANLIETESRHESEKMTYEMVKNGYELIHHSDNDHVIAGAGTLSHEIFNEIEGLNALFATCGGGGMLSGAVLARELNQTKCQIFGAEPALANDASRSFQSGKIFRFEKTPQTIAEGARTLSVTERNFAYLKKLDGFLEVSEQQILHANAWAMHSLKIVIEPTCAVAIAAAFKWLKSLGKNAPKQKVAIVISGGNIDYDIYQKIWAEDRLAKKISEFF